MSVLDTEAVKKAIDDLVRDAFNSGVIRGRDMAARIAKERAEHSMLLGDDGAKEARKAALYIEERIRRIMASHEADKEQT